MDTGILSLDVSEQKKGNHKLLLKSILRQLNSEEVEKSDDGGFSSYKKLHDHLSKFFQTCDAPSSFKQKSELSEHSLFHNNQPTDTKTQTFEKIYHLNKLLPPTSEQF